VPEEQQAPETPVETGAPQPVAESMDLAAQLEALRAKNQELIAERRKDREKPRDSAKTARRNSHCTRASQNRKTC
jgi:hypothetical protein